MSVSDHQANIVRVVIKGNPDGSPCDLDQIIERVDRDTNKASIQFSIRALINKGYIQKVGREKRRLRSRVLFTGTADGFELLQILNRRTQSTLSAKELLGEDSGTDFSDFDI